MSIYCQGCRQYFPFKQARVQFIYKHPGCIACIVNAHHKPYSAPVQRQRTLATNQLRYRPAVVTYHSEGIPQSRLAEAIDAAFQMDGASPTTLVVLAGLSLSPDNQTTKTAYVQLLKKMGEQSEAPIRLLWLNNSKQCPAAFRTLPNVVAVQYIGDVQDVAAHYDSLADNLSSISPSADAGTQRPARLRRPRI